MGVLWAAPDGRPGLRVEFMSLRIMIIDDNPADRALFRRLLRSSDLDHEVVEVQRVRDFLDMPLDDFDCILLDNRLPDRDGIDALNDLTDVDLPPIIILSGLGDERIAAQAIKSGAADYLMKDTVTPGTLSRAIRQSIDKWHADKKVRSERASERHALELAEKSNQAKTAFIAKLSHDLRTSLTGIMGFSKIITDAAMGEDPKSWERYRGYASDIERGAGQLLDLLSGVIDVASLEAGNTKLELSSFDPRRTLSAVADLWRPQADAKHVVFNTDVADAPDVIVSDEKAVRTVLENLVSNAVMFTPGGGHVRVTLTNRHGRFLEIVVADTGVGMDPDDLPWRLRPFEEHADEDGQNENGLGMGLPLVRSFVDLLNGTIRVDTALDLGTTAIVSIPMGIKYIEN